MKEIFFYEIPSDMFLLRVEKKKKKKRKDTKKKTKRGEEKK